MVLVVTALPALADCLTEAKLHRLEATYESALKHADVKQLKELLDEQYLWVHNLAVVTETKSQLLARLTRRDFAQPVTREAKVQHVLIRGDTAVVVGESTVTKSTKNADGVTALAFNRYQYQRTYTRAKQGCRILAVQTMKTASGSLP